jgi:hypothetical protein
MLGSRKMVESLALVPIRKLVNSTECEFLYSSARQRLELTAVVLGEISSDKETWTIYGRLKDNCTPHHAEENKLYMPLPWLLILAQSEMAKGSGSSISE